MQALQSVTVQPVWQSIAGIAPPQTDQRIAKSALQRATKLFNETFGKRLKKKFKLFDTTVGTPRDGIRHFEVYIAKHKQVDYVCADEEFFGSVGVPESAGKFQFVLRRHNTTPVVDTMDELADRFVSETWGGWDWFRSKVCV